MCLHQGLKIELKVRDVVWIVHGTCVVVFRDAFIARRIHQAIFRPAHCIEGLKRVAIQEALRIGSGMVSKHAEDESVCAWRDEKAEETAEVIGVLRDGFLIWSALRFHSWRLGGFHAQYGWVTYNG